jgi:pimeloyl-ACP methyl ester carboxylesterase
MRIFKTVLILIAAVLLTGIAILYMAPEKVAAAAIGFERWLAGLERKEIDLADGSHYVYLEGGKGEALILLHGFGANKDHFIRVARYLTPHFHVFVPDHIGFGESGHPPEADYQTAAQAQRVRALARTLGIDKPHLGGSSMGGHIAMMYATLFTDEVQSLWLLDPGGIWSAPPSELRTIIAETKDNPLLAKDEEGFARAFDFAMSDPPFIPRPVLNVMAQERIRNYPLEKRIFEDLSADSAEKYVTGLKTPALIVWGDQDRAIHVATAEMLRAMMTNTQVIVMPGIGHLPMLERPRQSADDYLQFRARLQK